MEAAFGALDTGVPSSQHGLCEDSLAAISWCGGALAAFDALDAGAAAAEVYGQDLALLEDRGLNHVVRMRVTLRHRVPCKKVVGGVLLG